MKPAAFKYLVPRTVDEAVSMLSRHGYDAKVLAGGQSLIPAMNFRLAQPAVLVDINHLAELSFIRAKRSEMRIGAMTRQRAVERDRNVAEMAPLVHETMPYIAHVQIRNRGTFGGSIAHADPAAELPAVMLARQARFKAVSERGERWIPADDFYLGMLTTALEPNELLAEIALEKLPSRSGWAFEEVARRHGDYALIGVAAVVRLGFRGRCKEARVVFLSAGDAPIVADQATKVLVGESPTPDAIAEAAEVAATRDIDPPTDIHASASFRRQLARTLAKRALQRAFDKAA